MFPYLPDGNSDNIVPVVRSSRRKKLADVATAIRNAASAKQDQQTQAPGAPPPTPARVPTPSAIRVSVTAKRMLLQLLADIAEGAVSRLV
jgi:hypothetical protein